MLNMKNGWLITDDDTMQCVKKVNDKCFVMVDTIWLDICSGEPCAKNAKDETDNYVVVEAVVDVSKLTLNEVECAISGYYKSISEMMNAYNCKFEDLYQLIAECYFESGICCYDHMSKVISWDDAEKYIQAIIGEDD